MHDKPKLRIDFATFDAAKFSCVHYHYSACMPAGKLVKLGAWENDRFIGVVIFGLGATRQLVQPYGLTMQEGCELVRVALARHQTPVSRIVSIAVRKLREFCPGIKLIVSFADPQQNHHGGIYQAMNWLYLGMTNASDEYIVNGKRLHGRSMRAKYGTHIGRDFIIKTKGTSKHRYALPFTAELREQLQQISKPYPKRVKQAMTDHQSEQRRGSDDRPAPLSAELK